MRRLLLPLVCACLAGSPSRGGEAGAERFVLDNGLTVLLRPAPRAAHASLVVLFSVGEDHDPEGASGLAHLVEHLYVTAAAGGTRPARTVGELIRDYPLGWNAQTGERTTIVATVFPAGRLESELAEAAARMGDLRVTAADLAREVPRVAAEVTRMFEGDAGLAAYNRARDLARSRAAGGRRGGLPAEVRGIGVEQARTHWRRFYKPRHARLSLAGRFDPGVARARIRELFGAIPGGAALPEASDRRPHPDRTIERVATPGTGARASAAWAAPWPGDPHYPAFLVLVARLAQAHPYRAGSAGPPPVSWLPVDDPGPVVLSAPLAGEPDPAALAALFDGRVRAAAAAPVGAADRFLVVRHFGAHLGLVPALHPYASALATAARDAHGIDPERLGAALARVDDEALGAAAAAVFDPARRRMAVATPRE